MRPSMRPVAAAARFRSSGRAHPFVCSQCQPLASPPCSLIPIRHASSDKEPPKDKLPFSEKFRRRIWGTDNPPGQKDPYSRASPEEIKRLWEEEARLREEEEREAAKRKENGWFGRRRKQEAQEVDESALSQPAAADLEPVKPGAPTQEDLEAMGYVPAQTWDGLPRIGGKYTKQMLIRDFMEEHPFKPFMPEEKVDLSSVRGIVWEEFINTLAKRKAPEDAGRDAVEAKADHSAQAAGVDEEGWENYDISNDLDFKFALVKRIMRTTGYRIPDPAIARFQTVGDIAAYMSTPPKPTTVAEQLLSMEELRSLPNVQIHAKRIGRHDKDVEFGRAKVIEAELARRGLLGRDGERNDLMERIRAIKEEEKDEEAKREVA